MLNQMQLIKNLTNLTFKKKKKKKLWQRSRGGKVKEKKKEGKRPQYELPVN